MKSSRRHGGRWSHFIQEAVHFHAFLFQVVLDIHKSAPLTEVQTRAESNKGPRGSQTRSLVLSLLRWVKRAYPELLGLRTVPSMTSAGQGSSPCFCANGPAILPVHEHSQS